VVRVNGRPLEVESGSSVADLVRRVTGDDDPRGVAVALDRNVVPRSEWPTTVVPADSQVEVVGAAAGG
jgi:sulfur carrier protein